MDPHLPLTRPLSLILCQPNPPVLWVGLHSSPAEGSVRRAEPIGHHHHPVEETLPLVDEFSRDADQRTIALVLFCDPDRLVDGTVGEDSRLHWRPADPPWYDPEAVVSPRSTLFLFSRSINPDLWMNPQRRVGLA